MTVLQAIGSGVFLSIDATLPIEKTTADGLYLKQSISRIF